MKNKLFIIESAIIGVLVIIIICLLVGKIKKEQLASVQNVPQTAVEVTADDGEEKLKNNPIEETEQEPVREVIELPVEGMYPVKDITGDGIVNIAVFGDSIWDDKRGKDGISEQLAALTGANVYNCAIGGTNAALVDESIYYEDWDTRSLNGMVYIARGTVKAEDQLTTEAALKVFKKLDFNQVDYVLFSYGINDYLLGVDISATESMYDMTTYYGAMRHAADVLPQAFPQLKIVIVAPTYCMTDEGDSSTYNNGKGTLENYVEVAKIVTETTERPSYFVDAYHDFGINVDTAETYLEDGIHLSQEGRKVYAEKLAQSLSAIKPE